jgi:two-component system, OmpR family, phosphate regulon response regulator PhoB
MTAVLVIDDDVMMRQIVQALLEAGGYDVTVAVDGPDGLARLAEAQADVVMVDNQMPGLSGADVVRRLRADASTRHLAVVLMSGGTAEVVGALARDTGADAHLVKPFVPGDVFAAVAGALDARSSP